MAEHHAKEYDNDPVFIWLEIKDFGGVWAFCLRGRQGAGAMPGPGPTLESIRFSQKDRVKVLGRYLVPTWYVPGARDPF